MKCLNQSTKGTKRTTGLVKIGEDERPQFGFHLIPFFNGFAEITILADKFEKNIWKVAEPGVLLVRETAGD